MSLATLERAIVLSARIALKNPKLRRSDLCEWSTSEVTPREDEVALRLPDPGVWIAVLKNLRQTGGRAMNLLVNTREYGGTYIARALKKQASATMSREHAAKAVVRKVLGNHPGDEPRLLRLNPSQFMADVTKLEGFETFRGSSGDRCCKCSAAHKIMFRRRRRVYCTGCAVRERTRFEAKEAK